MTLYPKSADFHTKQDLPRWILPNDRPSSSDYCASDPCLGYAYVTNLEVEERLCI